MNSVTRVKRSTPHNAIGVLRIVCVLFTLISFLSISTANAATREHAKRIYDRIAGVPPSKTILDTMVGESDMDAAFRAMDNKNFYEVTLKNMVAPWTNEAQTAFVPLNDYTATVIGMVRDDVDIRQMLYGDILYVGRASLDLPPYSMTNNNHYEALEDCLLYTSPSPRD